MEPEQDVHNASTLDQSMDAPAPRPDSVQIVSPDSADTVGIRDSHQGSFPADRPLLNSGSDGQLSQSHENPLVDFDRIPVPRVARSRDGHVRLSSRRATFMSAPNQNGSGLDWIVPMDEKGHTRKTVGERLQPTIDNAIKERDKYAQKALWTGYALNIAIGLQVLLGALTTACAAALTSAKQAQISTSILGGLATLVASYMARARGSGEPELSITRVKDLEQFIRECRAFQMDHAHEYGTPQNGLSERLEIVRNRFEVLLGNANGERKLSPVGITATVTQSSAA